MLMVFNWFFLHSAEIYFSNESLLSISTPCNLLELITYWFMFRGQESSILLFLLTTIA